MCLSATTIELTAVEQPPCRSDEWTGLSRVQAEIQSLLVLREQRVSLESRASARGEGNPAPLTNQMAATLVTSRSYPPAGV